MSEATTPGPAGTERFASQFRRFAACCVLVAIAFTQTPGRIVTDTKLDLTIDPGGFLSRALTMWDPNGAFGQVQNQAYGYLFPMGPFFWLGNLAHLDPWVVQRLWWSLIFVVAFLGMAKLCDVLEIGLPWVRIFAGLAFALSPRFLSVIGPSSIEVWPSAVAPWVLVPLVIGVRRGHPRRMAGLSALAVACVGGVNAAATFAVIPLGALWLLCAAPGPRRRTMMRWWPLFVLMATSWWLLPLFLLGRYSPPFLDYIETATNTTIASTLFDALRGTVNWIPYIDPYSNAGNLLISEPLLILNGSVILILGVVGLARRDLPHRRFLAAALFVGLLMVTMGHRGDVSGFGAGGFQSLLDGALAPLRNTHKFDPILRIPLILGLAHLVSHYARGESRDAAVSRFRGNAAGLGISVLAVAALLGATVPAWTGAIANRGDFAGLPGYWKQTATWLGQHGTGTALLLPATGFGDYVWGKTGDEPMQPLASSPWAVRNLIPLAPGGNIEMLDAVSRALSDGNGGASLGAFLERSGVRYLVVRNDIKRNQDIVAPEQVYATLATIPGVRSVAHFGPDVGGGPTLENDQGQTVFVDSGRQELRPAVEVFELGSGAGSSATTQNWATTPTLIGNATSLLALDRLGVTAGSSTVFAQDVPKKDVPGHVILTDGNRRQEAAFGTVNHNRTNSLTSQDAYSSNRPVHSYDQSAVAPWLAPPELLGAKKITASTSASEVNSLPYIDQAAQPWAAFDGDPDTAWRAGVSDIGKRSWLRIDFDEPTLLGTIGVSLGLPRGVTREITVTTEGGPRRVLARGGQSVPIDVGRVRSLKISGGSTSEATLEIAEVSIPGISLSRPLVMPKLPKTWGTPEAILMSAGTGYSSGCETVNGLMRCAAGKDSSGENGRQIDRVLTLNSAATYVPGLDLAARGGPAVTSLVQQGRLSSVSASSQVVASPIASALNAVDGDPRTGWIADQKDPDPTLSLNWVGAKKVSKLAIETDKTLAATAPTSAILRFSDGTSQTVPIRGGMARFKKVETDSIQVHLLAGKPKLTVDFSGAISTLPVGVSEVDVAGTSLYPIVLDRGVERYPCGTGPSVTIDGKTYKTAVKATRQQILSGKTLPGRVCKLDSTTLAPGSHRITINGSDAFRPDSLLLASQQQSTVAASSPVDTRGSTMTYRPEQVAGDQLLVQDHNVNAGWTATTGSTDLDPVVVNGWQQGWRVPAATAKPISTTFSPNRTYRVSLLLGAFFLVALVLLIARRPKPWTTPTPESRRTLPEPLRAIALVGGFVVVGFLGGLAAVGLAVTGFLISEALGRQHAVERSWIAAVPLGIAGLLYVTHPWASGGTWAGDTAAPQLMVAVVLGVLLSNALGGRLSLRWRKGFSIS